MELKILQVVLLFHKKNWKIRVACGSASWNQMLGTTYGSQLLRCSQRNPRAESLLAQMTGCVSVPDWHSWHSN